MTRPERYLTRMIIFLVAIIALGAFVAPSATRFFMANPTLNTIIVCVLIFGIVYTIQQVIMLRPEVAWAERFRKGDQLPTSADKPPRLLGPMSTMLGERRGRLTLSATSMTTLLDGVTSRLDEQRDLSRYLIGLLIFLGLLGTFWGLLLTVNSVGETIRNLQVSGGEFTVMFDALKAGLEAPLSGMGTAFSTSLFGLTGSLILGFLDLQASQAQSRFTNDLEEWLSSITRLGGGGPVGEGEGGSVPSYVSALLEQTAESLGEMQRGMARAADERSQSHAAMLTLSERLAQLSDTMRASQDLIRRMADNESQLQPVLQRLVASLERPSGDMDDASRGHLRNMEVYLARMLEDQMQGRNQAVSEIRSEVKLLARTLAAISAEER
jgi:hypothetical protein